MDNKVTGMLNIENFDKNRCFNNKNFQEKNVKEKQIQHWKEIIQLQEKLKTNQNRLITVTEKVEALHKEYKELEEVSDRDVTKEFAFRTKQRDLNVACKDFDRLKEEENTLTKKLQELDARPPSDVYLSSRDRQIIGNFPSN